MSIIIKGIDLPNSGQIELIIRPHGKVLSKTRGISAEAIQIPKKHGMIVDLIVQLICYIKYKLFELQILKEAKK